MAVAVVDSVASVIPPGLGIESVLPLLALSVVTSFITASVGAGGGLLLLGAMTLFMPPASVIAVHGVIQLGSNGGRTAMLARHIRLRVFAAFIAGGMVGATLGSQLVVGLPEPWFRLALGTFILWACWGPMPRVGEGSTRVLAAGGAITSFLTLFVGATGPFVAALLRALNLGRLAQVGTFSACMTAQHLLKVLVFAMTGFAFAAYLPFMLAMIGCGLLGTWVGRNVLERLPERAFRKMLLGVLTVLALRQVYTGLSGLW